MATGILRAQTKADDDERRRDGESQAAGDEDLRPRHSWPGQNRRGGNSGNNSVAGYDIVLRDAKMALIRFASTSRHLISLSLWSDDAPPMAHTHLHVLPTRARLIISRPFTIPALPSAPIQIPNSWLSNYNSPARFPNFRPPTT